MSSKTEKELKAPDMFLTTSEHVFHWIERNARAIAAVLVVLIVASVAYIGYSYWAEAQEKSATEALAKPENDLKNAETKFREARAAQMQAMAGVKSKKMDDVKSADYAKDYAPTVSQLITQIKNHSGTKAATVSALNLSNFLIQQKQYPQALEVLELPTYRPSMNDLLGGFWHMHRGLAMLENQKPDDALKEYKSILDSSSLKYFHPEAMLKTGVAYELKGDAAKARETYEKLSREFQGSEASTTAQQYIRLLELKPKG